MATSEKLERSECMQASFGTHVCGMSILYGIERSQITPFAVDTDAGYVFTTGFEDSKHSSATIRAGLALVLHLFASRYFAEIVDRIVRAIPIDVINLAGRPPAENVEPCQTMRFSLSASDFNTDVSEVIGVTSHFVGARAVGASAFKPSKHASFRIVMKAFAQIFRSKIGLSHKALQKLIGEKPERDSTRFGLRYFSVAS